MTERLYDDAESASIFELATEGPEPGQRQLSPAEGMTLGQLQEIGREAGISPEAVARAAAVLDLPASPPPRTLLGLPLGVSRTVTLGRRISDEEWERLVVLLRETFDARGTVRAQGSLRQWTNGNLQALLEPTDTGHRLRLRTTKGNAPASIAVGTSMLAFALVSFALMATHGASANAATVTTPALMGLFGAGSLGSTLFRLPRWARTRQRQMEEVAVRLLQGMASSELPAAR